MELVAQPFPGVHLGNVQTGCAVGERSKENEPSNGDPGNHQRGEPGGNIALGTLDVLLPVFIDHLFVGGVRTEDELNQSTGDHRRGKMRRKVMMQEELTAHEEEGQVVRSPCEEEKSSRVVKLAASFTVKGVDATALGELIGPNDACENGEKGRSEPPAHGVSEEINLLL